MSIETRFDIPFIAAMALREKQVQQNYRPIIAVHKWFARRPGTLFRGLLLAEFGTHRLDQEYFEGHDLAGKVVADPFMGGGTPLIEANRIGCDVHGCDINPMAAWIVREEIEHIDLVAYRREATKLVGALEADIGKLYRTDCPIYGDKNVPVKYFLWVKTIDCSECQKPVDLFPGTLLADDTRHTHHVLVCPTCGDLNEVTDRAAAGNCRSCEAALNDQPPASRGRCVCKTCGHVNIYPPANGAPLKHRLFAIEYFNPKRKKQHRGRFFKKPDAADLRRAANADMRWKKQKSTFAPDDLIPPGDETDRLHRWGYRTYADLFNARQLLGLELSCRHIAEQKDQRIRHALATNLSDLLRYQNMLCRYDTMALKSLDIFSVHGFPVGLVQCESNLLGITAASGQGVGSGGWTNIIEKYVKAKAYCDAPFEVQHHGKAKQHVTIHGEWIGETRPGARSRTINIHCASSTSLKLKKASLDAVFTDPPYFGNVQYAELMDFCFAWLRRLVPDAEGFHRTTTRAANELTGNVTEGRDLAHFTEGMAQVYKRMAHALKPGAPLAFTYHHNKLDAYCPIAVAVLDAGLRCSASIPCPAEMGGSIHIHGSNSSIIDTVFVCRANGATDGRLLFTSPGELEKVVRNDLGKLRIAGVKPTRGDVRCITFGHLTRMAIWTLRKTWKEKTPTVEKLALMTEALASYGNPEAIVDAVMQQDASPISTTAGLPSFAQEDRHAVSF